MLDAMELDAAILPRALRVARGHRHACRPKARPRPASGPARRSSPAAATRRRARSAWASCGRARSAPRSARRASSSPPPIGRRSIPAAASTRSVTRCPGRWHVMGVTQGAGLSLRWFRDQFGAGADDGRDPYDRLTEEAARVPPGCRRRALGAVPDGRAHAAPRSARARRARRPRRVAHARRTSSAPSSKASPSA